MSVLKSWIVCLIVLMDYTISVNSEYTSEKNNATQSNDWQSIVNCLNKQTKLITFCVFEQTLHRLDDAISSNETWQMNDYVSLKKNEDWKPTVLEARALRTPYGQIMSRVSNLLTSRSLQFSLPTNDDGNYREGRHYASGNSGLAMGMSIVVFE